jgi:very-short-patch-repair endonuclease
MDARIAAIAEGQYGVVARGQLVELGLEPGAIGRRLRAGRLHRLHWGVYAVGHKVLSREGRWMAAVLACGPHAVLSHRSAAAHWGLRDHRGPIDVAAPSKTKSRGTIRRHHAVVPADEVTVERGIPVTTVPRTIFDLAAVSSAGVAESALRESEYLQLHDRLSLPDLLARYPRRRGSPAVRECLARRAEASGRLRSRLEEDFLPFLRRHRVQLPQLNAWIPLQPRGCEVDCLWAEARQIVELDGYEGHGTRGAFREDRARDRRLRVAGYGVTRIAWAQLEDEPGEVAADLRALLASNLEYNRS